MVSRQARKNFQLIAHPYVFVLREGKKIKKDFLDYSLMMLQVTSPETIKSPPREKNKKLQFIPTPLLMNVIRKKIND